MRPPPRRRAATQLGKFAWQNISVLEQLQNISSLGMRVMGGRAYFEFEDMSRYYREAPSCLYAGGTIEIQTMLIARTMGLG